MSMQNVAELKTYLASRRPKRITILDFLWISDFDQRDHIIDNYISAADRRRIRPHDFRSFSGVAINYDIDPIALYDRYHAMIVASRRQGLPLPMLADAIHAVESDLPAPSTRRRYADQHARRMETQRARRAKKST